MFTPYGVFLLAIPFFILFPFMKNKKKFTVTFFLIYGFIVFIELMIGLYYYIYIMKR